MSYPISSTHLSEEEVLSSLYGLVPPGGHLANCPECQARAAALQNACSAVEREYATADAVSADFLAAQRRRIYARLDSRPASLWNIGVRRRASTAAALLVIGGGLAFLTERHPVQVAQESPKVSDEQLAQEIGQFAAESEPEPAEPLRALFE